MSKSQWTSYYQTKEQDNFVKRTASSSDEVQSPALEALRSLKESREKKFKEIELEQQIIEMERELERQRLLEEGKVEEEDELPSRKELFPSNYAQITKWFYNLIFIGFLAVLVALLLWGRHMVA
ncbi:hypothetical protein [Paenibacillus sp. 1001270B_150601_E10]|uniref:hypothetical protein n=1 Tax=Paenibacillus sp. 1001270B_150601_E10 TaxID=2787079 RepID=UPI00189DC642|nr:hypothetical protein [Paenibacillus sp. 1001270B_150601_E10]